MECHIFFSCDQAALLTVLSLCVCLSICHTFFTMFMSLYYQLSSNFQKLLALTKVMSMRKIKVRDQRSRSQRSKQILSQFGHFRTVTLVWIHIWLRNNAQSLKWYRKCALLYFKVICQISRSQGLKNRWFDPNKVFPDCKSSLNLQMAMK